MVVASALNRWQHVYRCCVARVMLSRLSTPAWLKAAGLDLVSLLLLLLLVLSLRRLLLEAYIHEFLRALPRVLNVSDLKRLRAVGMAGNKQGRLCTLIVFFFGQRSKATEIG